MTNGNGNGTGGRPRRSVWEPLLGFFIDSPLVVAILVALLVGAGLVTSPFDWDLGVLPRERVPVDAIPDVGENQQIVFTEWAGRSPRDMEDQVTYPLTTALLGIAGVRTVRSSSMLGFSTIYVIFEDGTDFYWSRSRVLEKLASIPSQALPDGVTPTLGPDATALGQVYWYTLEGRDEDGNVVGGFDLSELRSIQDWTVRYALQGVPGVSEAASVGGFVREYQVDVDPEALAASNVKLDDVVRAVRGANLDVGARTIEINRVEYVIRGLGFIEDVEDLEQTVVASREHTPIHLRDVAHVSMGPAQRRGALDDAGAEVVGGVVTVRFGANPMEVIERVHERVLALAPSLPSRVLPDGTVSHVTIVPFYDRTTLIHETLGTLSTALLEQILITIIVVLVMLRNMRTSLLVSLLLPLGVLATFVAMKLFGVDANIMALSGIAIAIGTMVDMGIVLVENIEARLDGSGDEPRQESGRATAVARSWIGEPRALIVRRAAAEVAPAVLTSTATTVVSFLPVFALTASEGKLFTPLAYTKTFALIASFLVAALVLPMLARFLLTQKPSETTDAAVLSRRRMWRRGSSVLLWLTVAGLALVLADDWEPFGPGRGVVNIVFVVAIIALVLGAFILFQRVYPAILAALLRHKVLFVSVPASIVFLGLLAWLGFPRMFGWLPTWARTSAPAVAVSHAFPGFGREYMPPFDEGSFLFMPTTMSHASLAQSLDMLHEMDAAIAAIPEVDRVVGKLGRAETALDPAPISMFETIITYLPEYRTDEDGERTRQWRDHIRTPHDIWQEIVRATDMPGLTSAPVLQPIATRLVMLQTGMRAPMGIKVHGPDLETIERFGLALEAALKEVPALRPETVFAERVVGKPYLEIEIDREAIGRYGLAITTVQDVIQTAIGGRTATRTVEGRERYPVRVRYLREERDSVEAIERVLVTTPSGESVPLEQLTEIHYVRGPQVIKAEDTFLTSYVLFDRVRDVAEVDAVEQAMRLLDSKIASGDLVIPEGVTYDFAGSYEHQVRSEKRLLVLIPVALSLIFLLLYLQFRRTTVVLSVFSGVAVAIAGGFVLLWLYGQGWFLDFSLFGKGMRELFQVHTVNMSVAVWVGFIALVGIATDDGVVMATYLTQRFRDAPAKSIEEIRANTLDAGVRRVRPCLMTTATTILALLPVITSQGRGSDVMVPMALPALGGMTVALVTLFVVPVLFAWVEELKLRRGGHTSTGAE